MKDFNRSRPEFANIRTCKALSHAMALTLAVLAMQRVAAAEIYFPAKAPTQRQASERELAFRKAFLVDAYDAVGVKNEKWDQPIRAFLADAPRSLAKLTGGPSLETLLDRSASIRKQGSNDALVRFFTSQILLQLSRRAESEALQRGLTEELAKQKYPPMWQFVSAGLEYQILHFEGKANKANTCIDIAAAAVREMTAPEVYGKDHRAELIADLNAGEESMPDTARRKIWLAARDVKGLDPVVALYLEALYENRAAVARNGIVNPEHYPRAVECYTKAWEQDPTIPEIPTAMIQIANRTMGPPEVDEWFQRAVKARVDYAPAFRAYIYTMNPKYGGDRRSMLEFGLACFNSSRFDTGVPLQFFDVLLAVRKNWDNGDMRGWAREEVFNKVSEIFERSTSPDGAFPGDPYYRSLEAAFFVQTGHFEEARKIIAELKGVVRETAAALIDTTPQEVRGAAAAFTGDAADAGSKARALIGAGDRKQAIAVYRAAAEKMIDPDGARLLRGLVQSNEWSEAFDSGGEVQLKANDELAGFHPQMSRWRADGDGGINLVEQNSPNPNLTCLADFGEHWELKAKLDFTHKEADWDSAGISLAVPGNANFLCLEVAPKTKTFFARSFHEVGDPVDVVVTDKANQFIVRREGLRFSVTVNGKPVFEAPTPDDDDTKRLRIGFGGYLIYKKDSVRFYDMTIRKTAVEKK